MKNTWILVANGHRARFFQHDQADCSLAEVAGFVYPAAAPPTQASTAQPLALQTLVATKSHRRFARQLADYLNKCVADQRCDRVALIATAPMLGAMQPMLSPVVGAKLLCSVASDLTHYQDSELRQRVQEVVGPIG